MNNTESVTMDSNVLIKAFLNGQSEKDIWTRLRIKETGGIIETIGGEIKTSQLMKVDILFKRERRIVKVSKNSMGYRYPFSFETYNKAVTKSNTEAIEVNEYVFPTDCFETLMNKKKILIGHILNSMKSVPELVLDEIEGIVDTTQETLAVAQKALTDIEEIKKMLQETRSKTKLPKVKKEDEVFSI